MAKILCGKEASAELRKNLQLEVSSYGPNFKPGLTIVQVKKNQIFREIDLMKIQFHEKKMWNFFV